jgi:hypothetical protein
MNIGIKNLNQNRMAEEAKMALLLFTVGIVLIGIGLIKKHGQDE